MTTETTSLTIKEAEATLGDAFARVEGGQIVDIERGGRAVLRLRPVPKDLADESAQHSFVGPTPRYPKES